MITRGPDAAAAKPAGVAVGFLGYADRLGYRRRWIAAILSIQLFAVVFEGIGIGVFLPILEFMSSDGDVGQLTKDSALWRFLFEASDSIGVPLNFVTLLVFAFAAFVIRQIFVYFRLVYTAKVQYEFIRQVRVRGFKSFLGAKLDYHDTLETGKFVNELTTELTIAVSCLNLAVSFFGYIILCLVYMTIAVAMAPAMTGVAILVLLAAAAALVGLMRRTQRLGQAVTAANQGISDFLLQRLKSVRLVRLSGMEAAEHKTLAALAARQRDHLVALRVVMSLVSVLVEPFVVAVGLVLLYVSFTVLALPLANILVFFLILVRLVPVVKEALVSRQAYLGSLASISVVDARLRDLEAARDVTGGERRLTRLDRDIRFAGISFAYRGAGAVVPALNDVTLRIPARSMTALVGPSGAGKSTLVDLLPRLRAPSAGTITFDGAAQPEFEVASLRRAIAFMPQAPQIFNVTAAEHIRYGRPDASDAQVRAAAETAQAHDFITALPNGYNTRVGEQGALLSGGQRQRLDLARALIGKAPILVLDEPTSNLDAESERLFLDALQHIRARGDATLIVIAHHLSTVALADLIYVIEDGRVRAQGSHDDLMRRDDWYRRAFAAQHSTRAAAHEPTVQATVKAMVRQR